MPDRPTLRKSKALLQDIFQIFFTSPIACKMATPIPDKVYFTSDLVKAHNAFRKANGRKPLTLDDKLQKACEKHARDMASHQIMSHVGTDGSSPFQRMTAAGYQWRMAGENIAWNQQTVTATMTSWKRSPGHRMNMLMAYANIGAACVYSAKGEPYWCVDFGSPTVKVRHSGVERLKTVGEKTDDTASLRGAKSRKPLT